MLTTIPKCYFLIIANPKLYSNNEIQLNVPKACVKIKRVCSTETRISKKSNQSLKLGFLKCSHTSQTISFIASKLIAPVFRYLLATPFLLSLTSEKVTFPKLGNTESFLQSAMCANVTTQIPNRMCFLPVQRVSAIKEGHVWEKIVMW